MTHRPYSLYGHLTDGAYGVLMDDDTWTAGCPDTEEPLGVGLTAAQADAALTGHTAAPEDGERR